MLRTWAELFQRRIVLGGSISFMPFKAISRIVVGHRNHDAVTGNLGNNRRGGDSQRTPVTFYKRLMWKGKIWGFVAVNECIYENLAVDGC